MTERFEWIPDVSAGEFLRPMDRAPKGTIFDLIPPGFAAYARIFHPVERDRPATERSWAGLDMYEYIRKSAVTGNEVERASSSWATAAQAFGTHMHAQAQFHRLTKQDPHNMEPKVAADGWSYSSPQTGTLTPQTLGVLASVLAQHTTIADSGVAAIWEGYGGLTSSAGITSLTAWDSGETGQDQFPDPPLPSLEVPLGYRARSFFGRIAQRLGLLSNGSVVGYFPGLTGPEPELGSGMVSKEIATGPRLSLAAGTWNYILFQAGAQDFIDGSWADRAPWISAPFEQSPTYLWPDDQTWALHTNVDLDSSIIGGSQELVDQLLQTPGLEALALPVDADLTWAGDKINPSFIQR